MARPGGSGTGQNLEFLSMDFTTEQDQQAIQSLCRIEGRGLLSALRIDFANEVRHLPTYDALDAVHCRVDAEKIGRAAEELLGIPAEQATQAALELLLPDRRRQLALELIREVDSGQRDRGASSNGRQAKGTKPSAIDRANRKAVSRRKNRKRRASA